MFADAAHGLVSPGLGQVTRVLSAQVQKLEGGGVKTSAGTPRKVWRSLGGRQRIALDDLTACVVGSAADDGGELRGLPHDLAVVENAEGQDRQRQEAIRSANSIATAPASRPALLRPPRPFKHGEHRRVPYNARYTSRTGIDVTPVPLQLVAYVCIVPNVDLV